MLKWTLSPRINADFFDEPTGNNYRDTDELLTLQTIVEQHQLPCLVRIVNNDVYDSIDNYCLLLCQTTESYLIVSNETERFSVPVSFDGLFAPVERGVTRYNVLQSIRALQTHLKTPTSLHVSDTPLFTTLQACMTYGNSSSQCVRPGTILELSPPSSLSSPSTTSNRLRALFANLPHSFNKHRPIHTQYEKRLGKTPSPPTDYLEVKSIDRHEHFYLKIDSMGMFVPVHTKLLTGHSQQRSSHLPYSTALSSNQIQGLYNVEFLSQLTEQYPLITELIISQTLEENVPTTVGYPCRRITLHRLIQNHSRIIAFDMKNYAFVEIDASNDLDIYTVEQDDTLFQRYQAQLRWCEKHLASFRTQIKTIVHSTNGIATFVQATPFHGQQLQPYHQRRNSSSIIISPLNKHIPRTIFTSQESISPNRARTRTPVGSKFHTTSNHHNYQQKQQGKGKTTGNNNGLGRKDVRVYFNDPTIQQHLQVKSTIKQTSFHQRSFDQRMNSTETESLDANEEQPDDSFQCTSL